MFHYQITQYTFCTIFASLFSWNASISTYSLCMVIRKCRRASNSLACLFYALWQLYFWTQEHQIAGKHAHNGTHAHSTILTNDLEVQFCFVGINLAGQNLTSILNPLILFSHSLGSTLLVFDLLASWIPIVVSFNGAF